MLFLLVLSLSFGDFLPFPGPGPDVTVAAPCGKVVGRKDAVATSYLGIPYAEAPVGPLRWMPPVAKAPFASLNATAFGPGCPQTCELPPLTCPAATDLSEDCLQLNVFVPNRPLSSSLPVVVFLPGGNFRQGAASTLLYDSRRWVSHANDLIVVTTNYRLGALGWLIQDGIDANLGIQDQRLALRWVQDNIAAFGGNSSQITLMGQSAGATSVGYHLLSSKSRGLFQQYIMESNPVALPLKNPKDGERFGDVFMKHVGCAKGDISCLRNKSVAAIVAAQDETQKHFDVFDPFLLFYPWTPTVDVPDNVDKQPIELLHEGAGARIPGIVGTVANESIIFIYLAFGEKGMTSLEYEAFILDAFPLHVGSILERYPHSLGGNASMAAAYLATDFLFTCANRWVVRGQARPGAPVYRELFDHPMSFGKTVWGPGAASHCYYETCHAGELAFIFNPVPDLVNPTIHMTAEEKVLTDSMQGYWSNFIGSGDPNVGASSLPVKWPAYNATTDENLRLTTPKSYVQSGLKQSACDFWDTIGYARGDIVRFLKAIAKFRQSPR